MILEGCSGIKRDLFTLGIWRGSQIIRRVVDCFRLDSFGQDKRGRKMSRHCMVTGKKPASGNNVSHAHNKTKRRFSPNIHTHRFWVESESRFVKLRVSTKGMRIIDKLGIDAVLVDIRSNGMRV